MDADSMDFTERVWDVHEVVRGKFSELAARRGVDPVDIDYWLRRSRMEPPDTHTFYHLARTLGLRGVEAMQLRSVRLSPNTSAFFVVDGDKLIEVFSFRGLRQMRKKWQHESSGELGGGTPQERHANSYKFEHARRTGGGLLNQNSGPRNRRK